MVHVPQRGIRLLAATGRLPLFLQETGPEKGKSHRDHSTFAANSISSPKCAQLLMKDSGFKKPTHRACLGGDECWSYAHHFGNMYKATVEARWYSPADVLRYI